MEEEDPKCQCRCAVSPLVGVIVSRVYHENLVSVSPLSPSPPSSVPSIPPLRLPPWRQVPAAPYSSYSRQSRQLSAAAATAHYVAIAAIAALPHRHTNNLQLARHRDIGTPGHLGQIREKGQHQEQSEM